MIAHELELRLAEALERQSELNTALARCLESVALTADRYDAELAELRDELLAVSNRLESVTRVVRARTDHLA